ncbi:glycine--tRNA ligase subunit beta [Henriciella mobilis]|uniref:glycine--tRNA ligase subunit beta n=1 Tax=Henriciella mobilis TaxID=2305467 RepID=UPI000E663897|nr:glycine--tRNA ligase subunit beta [Henriciella mobilis]RIJ13925.1 glycine--tRNA ligase subunit beta [Henriciella mobilis]RIJ20866.1 glycine--tRNA ligase subunit beta [Henriciella mobilis]
MAELLLELFSEEIPARMQAKAEADLKAAVESGLSEAGVAFERITALSGPRRLTVCVEGLPAKSADVKEERKGPKVGAPEKAVEGFLRGAGLNSIDEAEVRSDPKKGDFYVAVREVPGRPLPDIIAEMVPDIVRSFHWPKSMRWGRGELRWVRPLQRVLCIFDGKVVDFEIDGLTSGNETEGHRVHGRGPFKVSSFDEYKTLLESKGSVILSREDRRLLIDEKAHVICHERGLELVEDKGLLEEVTGLAEWPVVILGDMDPDFLSLPGEVIQLSMRTHQKYFAVRDPKTGDLAPHFVVVANIDATDGGKAIAEGNSRVLSARLDDARFFWDNDRKTPLATMAEKLKTIDFKKELGTVADKVERIAALARDLAPKVGADPDLAERAARLAKADLVSGMVGEFPELQGVMGGYYAREQGEDEAVATAIAEHYKPVGPSDQVPSEPVSIAVALADKLDTLVGFWAIDEKPTGSKDPFALRRAALGVVRIILENGVRIDQTQYLADGIADMLLRQPNAVDISAEQIEHAIASASPETSVADLRREFAATQRGALHQLFGLADKKAEDLLAFFADRLKQYLRDAGARYDLIDAVFALENQDDLVLIVKRVEALGAFLETDDGANLLAGYKRAANILKAEEKKDGRAFEGTPDPALFEQDEERSLAAAITESVTSAEAALAGEDFEKAMGALSSLRAPVDAFFDAVTVNAESAELRQNRLLILTSIRDALHRVADFSKLAA